MGRKVSAFNEPATRMERGRWMARVRGRIAKRRGRIIAERERDLLQLILSLQLILRLATS